MIEDMQDWVDYCEGKQSFDAGHFYTMFHDLVPLEDIEKVFRYFSEEVALKERFMNVYNNTTYNTDLYFELWKNQADYLITDDNVLLIRTDT